ncbi:hypothetical protein GCM10017687_66000 [Streptomyces echinatus]
MNASPSSPTTVRLASAACGGQANGQRKSSKGTAHTPVPLGGIHAHPALLQPTGPTRQPRSLCLHTPPCPTAQSADAEAARVVTGHPEQDWSLLCNGVLVFEDTGELAARRTGHRLAPTGRRGLSFIPTRRCFGRSRSRFGSSPRRFGPTPTTP